MLIDKVDASQGLHFQSDHGTEIHIHYQYRVSFHHAFSEAHPWSSVRHISSRRESRKKVFDGLFMFI